MALIETFTDPLTNLSNWSVIYNENAIIAASGGTLSFTPDGTGTVLAYLGATVEYEFANSWTSVRIPSLFPSDTTLPIQEYIQYSYGALSSDFTISAIFTVVWDSAGSGNVVIQWPDFSSSSISGYAGEPIIMGIRVHADLSGFVAYSLDDGATWVKAFDITWDNTDTTMKPLFLIQAGSPVVNVAEFTDYNVYEVPLTVDEADPTITITPGTINFEYPSMSFILPTPLTETFSDNFANLSNWFGGAFSGSGTVTAAGTLDFYFPSGSSSLEAFTNDPYTLQESWMTVEVLNVEDVPANSNQEFLFGMLQGSPLDRQAISLKYNTVGDTVTIAKYPSPGSVTTTIPAPGVPILLGIRVVSNLGYYCYSIDGGTIWTVIGSASWNVPVSSTNPEMVATLSGTATDFTLHVDNYNVHPAPALVPLVIDLSTAGDIDFEGPALSGLTFGPPSNTITPGVMRLIGTSAPSIILSEAPFVISIVPGQMTLSVMNFDPIVGTYTIGDPFAAPINIRESGSGTYNMTGMTLQSGEPTTAHTRSLWLRYEADGPMNVSFSATSVDPFVMELFDGDSFSNLTVARSGSSFSEDVITGYTYVRLTSSTNTSISVDWSYVVTPGSLMMDILEASVERTPDDIHVAVQGGSPNESIRFTWSPPVSTLIPSSTPRPITLATVTSDTEGNISSVTLPIPPAYHGTYTVNARGLTSGYLASDTFLILEDPLPQDSDNSDVEPTAVAGPRWVFDDAFGNHWTMDINPSTMSSLTMPKTWTAERTTSGNGQNIIWQGVTPAVDFNFSGTLFSEEEYDSLVSFYELDHKFFLITHKAQTLTVTFRSLDVTPRKNGLNFQTWDYKASLLVYKVA